MYKLGEQFKERYELAKTNVSTVFSGDNYRITILSETLVRLEYNEQGVFEDRPTEIVNNRSFKNVAIKTTENNGILLIETAYFILEYAMGKSFPGNKILPGGNLKVTLKNADDKVWWYGNPEARNFGGTYSSLDGMESIKLEQGLYSTDGFATIDDSESFVIDEGGGIMQRESGIDIYVFAYNTDFDKALTDYFTLTGFPAFIPRYALGVWYSKNDLMNQEYITELASEFKQNNVPLSILYLNHWFSEGDAYVPSGYTWHSKLYPNPKQMIDHLHEQNIKLGLYVNPAYGIYPKEAMYEKAAEYLNVANNEVIKTNPASAVWIDVYLKLFIQPLEALGVDFFVNDYHTDSLTTLSLLNRYQFLDANRTFEKRAMLLARNGMKAAHRFPVHYTGNLNVSYKTLAMLPRFNMAAANVGLSWISNDIGGFTGGIEDPELYRRFVQFGTFSPILRLNADGGRYYKRVPWKWDVKTRAIASEYLRLRHKLIPYLYSEAYRYHEDGTPLVRPLYYQDESLYDSVLYGNQYYFGSQLLVAPITTPSDELIKRSILRTYLPEGMWYDFQTGKRYRGNNYYISFYKDEGYPVFAKAGSIIPLNNDEELTTKNPGSIEFYVFPGSNGNYDLYEDDGETNMYKQGHFSNTSIEFTYEPNQYTLNMRPTAGKMNVIPATRDYKFRFRNTANVDSVAVMIQGRAVEHKAYAEKTDFIIELKQIATSLPLTITCSGEGIEEGAVKLINDDIDDIINDLSVKTALKEQLNEILFSDLPIDKKRIKIRRLKSVGLDPKTINMFLKLLEYVGTI